MLQLIFCSVLNGRGQGKTRSHFRRGLLFCSSSGTWMSGDGDPTAGRRGKLTTGNIRCGIIPHLIFCLRARKWCLAYSIRESKPFVRRDSSANDVCSIAEIIPFPASMIGETCSHESAVSNGSRWEISDRTRCPGAWRIGGWGLRRRTRNGEYQLRGFLATDIPNHSRRRNGSSESLTEREALRSGWSAVRNRSSFLVGAKVFELRFRIEPVVNATERYIDRDGPRPVVVQSSRNGKAFKNTPADEFLTEMGHVEIPGFHADGDGTIDGRQYPHG